MTWYGWLILGVWICGQVITFREIVRINLWKWGNYMFESVMAGIAFSLVWPLSLPVVWYNVHPSNKRIGEWWRGKAFQPYGHLDKEKQYLKSRYNLPS